MGKIDSPAGDTSPRREWCVHVAVSVVQNVPRELLAAWIACECYQRDNAYFWPDNRALAPLMGVGPISSVQRLLLRLERLGIIERRHLGGNRRVIALRRRTSEAITPGEWANMELLAEGHTPKRTGPGTSSVRCQGTSSKRSQE